MVCEKCENCYNYLVSEIGCFGNDEPCECLMTEEIIEQNAEKSLVILKDMFCE